MTTTETKRRLVTVPRSSNAHAEAIEKSGLVNITSTGILSATGLTYTFVIFGEDPADPETGMMTLSIELDAKEYIATQKALAKVAARRTLHTVPNEIERMELDHLRTLLAEAAAPEATK